MPDPSPLMESATDDPRPLSGKVFLASWNVNGFRSILGKGFLDWVENTQPSILCLQETKATASQIPRETLPFAFQHYCSAAKAGYSGTALLSRYAPISVSTGFNPAVEALGKHPQEGRLQTADFGSFYLVNAYVPNAQSDLKRLEYRRLWNEDFRLHLASLAKVKPVIACGDLNVAHREIDLARPAENRGEPGFSNEEREDFEALLKEGFHDVFREEHPELPGQYTWWSYRAGARQRNVGWRIDYFIVSTAARNWIVSCPLFPQATGSDHCPVGLEMIVP